jgi:hypothetical protein
MSEQDAYREAVFFFDGDRVSSEMHFTEFESLLSRASTVGAMAATVVKAAYVVIGTGLAVRGMVCFLLRVDEEGYADPTFSVPLRHLVKTAGPGPDVGCGRIRLATRSQCSVAWQAKHLWEPADAGGGNPIRQVQEVVWRNRLGIKVPEVAVASVSEPATTATTTTAGAQPSLRRRLEDQIDQAFGEDRKVSLQQVIRQHKTQVQALKQKFRLDLEQQQQIYLDQISRVQDEVRQLRARLQASEQQCVRLQQLLRGETPE